MPIGCPKCRWSGTGCTRCRERTLMHSKKAEERKRAEMLIVESIIRRKKRMSAKRKTKTKE